MNFKLTALAFYVEIDGVVKLVFLAVSNLRAALRGTRTQKAQNRIRVDSSALHRIFKFPRLNILISPPQPFTFSILESS